MKELNDLLEAAPVVPLIVASDPDVAVKTADALAQGGLRVIEVVLRTPSSLECLKAISEQVDNVIVGAGTVLSVAQAKRAMDCGAQFIVSPGLDRATVEFAQDLDIPIFPGVMTPTEVMAAYSMGIRVMKFFPASIAGGIPGLKALGSVFREVSFMPTGGVSAANLSDFLSLPFVVACGGSWLTPASATAAGQYEEVTRLASEAVAIANASASGT